MKEIGSAGEGGVAHPWCPVDQPIVPTFSLDTSGACSPIGTIETPTCACILLPESLGLNKIRKCNRLFNLHSADKSRSIPTGITDESKCVQTRMQAPCLRVHSHM